MRQFTTKEDKYLEAHYLTSSLREMGEALGRSEGTIWGRLKSLKLEVPKSVKIANITKARAANTKSNLSLFRKGQTPQNKGKKQTEYMTAAGIERSAKTRFPKGNLPHNTKENGAISIRKDKRGKPYKLKRVGNANWIYLQRLVWEEHNGPITPGMLIKFKDGNTLNCDIENLYMTDRKGNMQDNTIARYPKNLQKAIRATHRLEKTIKNQDNEQTSQY